MLGLSPDVIIAAGYAVFLALVAAVLERLARQSHGRTEQFHRMGFRYDQESDEWECPAGGRLYRIGTYSQRRYRAPAHRCNACGLKPNCTDSSTGREIEHHSNSWLTSELRRFHHVVSLTLLVLAALILALEAIAHRRLRDLLALLGLLAPIIVAAARRASRLKPDATSAPPSLFSRSPP